MYAAAAAAGGACGNHTYTHDNRFFLKACSKNKQTNKQTNKIPGVPGDIWTLLKIQPSNGLS